MLRTRLAAVALAAGLGLVSGCGESCHSSLFSRFRTCSGSAGCCPAECASGLEGGYGPACDGPVLDQGAPYYGQPAYPAAPPAGAPAAPPGEVMPQLTAPPRLVPQAQPTPYTPSFQSRTAGR
jgi:hypothetical protein